MAGGQSIELCLDLGDARQLQLQFLQYLLHLRREPDHFLVI